MHDVVSPLVRKWQGEQGALALPNGFNLALVVPHLTVPVDEGVLSIAGDAGGRILTTFRNFVVFATTIFTTPTVAAVPLVVTIYMALRALQRARDKQLYSQLLIQYADVNVCKG